MCVCKQMPKQIVNTEVFVVYDPANPACQVFDMLIMRS
jgi:hypothetical protein